MNLPEQLINAMQGYVRGSAALTEILTRHSPELYVGTIRCQYCRELCHSHSGLGCEIPYDAPYPCPDVRTIATLLAVEIPTKDVQ